MDERKNSLFFREMKTITLLGGRSRGQRKRRTALRINIFLGSLMLLGGPFNNTASALRCFSCHACSAGEVLSARMQQCPPTEKFCAAVYRPRVGPTGSSFISVDRGCASSVHAVCLSEGSIVTANTEDQTQTYPQTGTEDTKEGNGAKGSDDNKETAGSLIPSSQLPLPPSTAAATTAASVERHCCSTDLCNGSTMRWDRGVSGTLEMEGYRHSEEHRRNLMEGTRSSTSGGSRKDYAHAAGWRERPWGSGEQEVGNNSAPREGGGSRLATVLVIVGTFAQVLWLAGSFLQ